MGKGRLEWEYLWVPEVMETGLQEILPWVFCYRAAGETGVLDVEIRERRRSLGSLPGFLAGMACCLLRLPVEIRGGKQQRMRGGNLGGDGLWDPQEMEQRGRKAAAGVLLQPLGLN